MIARGLSLFVPISCHAVPRKRRESFVANAVRRAAPFADPAWHAAWRGDQAMVWVWPREKIEALPPDATGMSTLRPARRYMPEALLRGEPHMDGLELLRCSDGIEARAWRQGSLYASSWWPQLPDAQAWATFCRGAGFAPQAMPAAIAPDWRERPWTAARDTSLRDALTHSQHLALPVLAGLVILVAAYQGGALLRVALARLSVEREIAQDSARVSDILEARNHAENDLSAARALLALRPPVPQVTLLSRVAELLDANHARVLQWSMPNPQAIEVLVSMASPDPRALVLAFQKAGLFEDVAADIGRGGPDQLIIRAKVAAHGGTPEVRP